jgi:two-component system response regulator
MTLFRSLLRFTITAKNILETFSPAEKLNYAVTLTNNYVANIHGDTGMFATIFIGLLNPEDGKLSYINAGHERPILISGKSGAQQDLESTGIAAGVIPDWNFSVEEIMLEPGDLLFAYTDGVPEVIDIDEIFFGKKQLFDLLESDVRSAADLIGEINTALIAHVGNAKQFDDITMLAVKCLNEKK